MEVEPQASGPAAGWTWVEATPPPAPAESTATAPVPRMPAGVPARGRGTQFNPTVPNQAVSVATTPLAHPTGIDAIDGMTSPVGLASLAAGGYGIATAGAAEGAVGAARAGFAAASPIVKYEAAKHLLLRMGVPSGMAELAAATVSGIKSGAKAAPAEAAATAETAAAETAAAPAAEAATAAQSGPRTVNDAMADAVKKYQAEAKAKAAAKAATTSRVETAPGGTPPRSGPPTFPATGESAPAASKVKLTGTQAADLQTLTKIEGELYLKLRVQGKTHQQARDAIAAMRHLSAGLPTDADVARTIADRNRTGKWPE